MNNQRPRTSIESLNLSCVLPHDLVRQMLLRLPVRSLLRFKSVCKSWLACISNPQFGKSHYDLAAAPTHRCLTKVNDSEVESLDIDAYLQNYESFVVNLKYPLSSITKSGEKVVEFLGSCRGFILAVYPDGDVYVWNPSTGVHRRIADDLDEMKYFFLNGFGYDTSTDDYLLVLIEVIPFQVYRFESQESIDDHPTRIRLFSMKSNSWFYPHGTYVQYVDMEDPESSVGSFLNEALHWLVTSYGTDLHVIIAFHLVERTLSEIALSQTLTSALESKPYEYHLRVMGECLSLCYPGDADSMVEIWMMKDYKVQSSWTKLFVFPTCNIPYNTFYPTCFTKHGIFFGSNGSGKLMILNDKGWLLDKWKSGRVNHGTLLHCGIYRESLLSLPNDSEEANDDFEEASKDDPADKFLGGSK